MNEKFRKWLDGDIDVMENITETALEHDASREELKQLRKRLRENIWNFRAQAGSSVPSAGLHRSYIG